MLVRFEPSINMRREPISQIKQVVTNKQTQVSKCYFSILIRTQIPNHKHIQDPPPGHPPCEESL